MELTGYNSEDPLFQESSVKSESRGGEIEMDKEKRRVTRREKDMSRARIAVFTLKNKERKGKYWCGRIKRSGVRRTGILYFQQRGRGREKLIP
ncbi:hypothetical protein NC651_022465 [Populus alba x Populus x berolinensis]|nr:hypothetical protein NC651_022465 [Populus alba x Populus x berolinensis]